MIAENKREKITCQPGFKGKALQVGAMVSSVLALVAARAELANASTASPQKAKSVAAINSVESVKRVESVALEQLNELPGWGIEVSGETQNHLRDSTVQIQLSSKDGMNVLLCSGVKTGPDEVDTAGHCFAKLISNELDFLRDKHPTGNYKSHAERQGWEYTIVDPKLSNEARRNQPIAVVTEILIGETDEAVLKVLPLDIKNNPSQEQQARTFETIPTMDKSLELKPKLGQKVTLSGAPVNANVGRPPEYYQLLTLKGIYLGQYNRLGMESLPVVDLVGTTSTEYRYCTNGTSGSSYAANIGDRELLSGALSAAWLLTQERRKYWSEELGIDLTGIQMLCFYNAKNK